MRPAAGNSLSSLVPRVDLVDQNSISGLKVHQSLELKRKLMVVWYVYRGTYSLLGVESILQTVIGSCFPSTQIQPRMRSVLFFAGDGNGEGVGRQHVIIKNWILSELCVHSCKRAMEFFNGLCRLGCRAPAVMSPLDSVGVIASLPTVGICFWIIITLAWNISVPFDQHLGERNFIVPLVWCCR